MRSRAAQLVKGDQENIEVLDPQDNIFTPSETSRFTTIGVSTSYLAMFTFSHILYSRLTGRYKSFSDGTGSCWSEHWPMHIPLAVSVLHVRGTIRVLTTSCYRGSLH
jgi:hypothetical protein